MRKPCTTNYSYAGAKVHLTGGGFLGFGKIAASDPQIGITTLTAYSQNYPYQSLLLNVEKRTSNGTLLNRTQNTWQNTAIRGSYHLNNLVQTEEQSFDLNGTPMPRTLTVNKYDTYGNPIQITVVTENSYHWESIGVFFSLDGSITAAGSHVKVTQNTYTNDTNN